MLLQRDLDALLRRVFFNSSRIYLHRYLAEFGARIPASARVLDAGAGDCRYRELFAHAHYEATDFCQVDKPYALGEMSAISDLHWLPFTGGSYDYVICSQVMEHLREPQWALGEFFRVLKPGGQLFLSAPLFYEEHEVPYDFYRYTQYGLRHLLEASGFVVNRMEWLEGYFGTLSYEMKTMALALPVAPAVFGGGAGGLALGAIMVSLKGAAALASLGFGCLDLGYKDVGHGHCKNYVVEAQKPPG